MKNLAINAQQKIAPFKLEDYIGVTATFLVGNDYITGEIEAVHADKTVDMLCPLAQRWLNVPISELSFP